MRVLKIATAALWSISLFAVSCSKKTTAVNTSGNAPESVITETKVEEKKDMAAAGKIVFESRCNKCHALYDPAQFTSQEWRPLVQSMSERARLNPDEKIAVLTYVMKNAKSAK